MAQSDQADSGRPPLLQIIGLQDRIDAFHADHEAERWLFIEQVVRLVVPVLPFSHVPIQSVGVRDHARDAVLLEGAIVRELTVGGRVRLVWRGIIDVGHGMSGRSGQQRDEAEREIPASQFGEANGSLAASRVGQASFVRSNGVSGAFHVAIPLKRVPRDIEVRVDYEHG